MSSKVYSLDELTALIKPLIVKYGAEEAILFGSYARQEATAGSDIDLMVIGGNRFDPTDIFCIADELFEIAGKNVDVYEQREINFDSGLYRSIQREGVKIL